MATATRRATTSGTDLKRSYEQARESAADAHRVRHAQSVPALKNALKEVNVRLGAIGNDSYARDTLVQPALQALLAERVKDLEGGIVTAITKISAQLSRALIGRGLTISSYDISFSAEELKREFGSIERTDVREGNLKRLLENTNAFLTKLDDVVTFLRSAAAKTVLLQYRAAITSLNSWIPTTELLNTYARSFKGSPGLEMTDSLSREGRARTVLMNVRFKVLERFSDTDKLLIVLITQEKARVEKLRSPAQDKRAALEAQKEAFEASKAEIVEIKARIAEIDTRLNASSGTASTAESLFSGFLGTDELSMESAMTDGLRRERETLVESLARLE